MSFSRIELVNSNALETLAAARGTHLSEARNRR